MNSHTPFFYFLLFAAGSIFFYLNFQDREYGWDMPGYLGSYYILENPGDKQVVLDQVFSSIKKEAPKASYDKMVGFHNPENWNDFISKNPVAFAQQIPYYSIKVFYVSLIYCFIKLGFTPPIAAFLPNLISFFIFGFLLFSIFRKIFENKWVLPFFISLFLLAIPHFRYLASIPSPDMLTALLMVWFLYSVIQKQNLWIQSMILMLIVFTRPDMVLFALSFLGIYFVYHFLKERKINFSAIISFVTLFLVYVVILKVNNYPGWNDVFYDTFIQRRRFISSEAVFSFQQYKSIIFENLVNFKKITLLSVIFLTIIIYFSKSRWMKIFAICIFLNIYLKFLFFPAPGEYRFFAGFLLLLFILSIDALKDKFPKITKTSF